MPDNNPESLKSPQAQEGHAIPDEESLPVGPPFKEAESPLGNLASDPPPGSPLGAPLGTPLEGEGMNDPSDSSALTVFSESSPGESSLSDPLLGPRAREDASPLSGNLDPLGTPPPSSGRVGGARQGGGGVGGVGGVGLGSSSLATGAGSPAASTLNPTIHSDADGAISSLSLSPPGAAPAAPGGNAVSRAAAAFFGALFRLWKRIPPLEDIFDMIVQGLGFQRKPASMLRRAQALAAKGRHADAIKWYRDILYLRPLTISAYDGLGRVYFRMGLTEDANREFTIADSLERLVNNRDDLEAACSLAQALVERKQAKMASSLLEPVLIAHFYTPNNANLLKRMGAVYAELRATKKMYQVYEAGLAQHPDDHEFYILKGNLEVKLGKSLQGEKLIRWGKLLGRLKDNPQDINANTAMGELLIKENRNEEGLTYLREAAILSPENSGIRWRLFNLYQREGNFPEALRYFQEVVAIEPDNEELRYKLADFYRKNRHYEEAFQIYKTLSLKHPRDPKPHSLMASVLKDMGNLEESDKVQELANTLAIGVKEEPDHRETVKFMKYLFGINATKEAMEWLDRGLARWPYHGELIVTKVKILYNEYRYKEAVNLLKRLISVKHDLAEPHMWMALCYQRLGNNMAALAEAQMATRLAPKSFTAHKILGDILKEQKKLSQANAAYEVADMIRLSQNKKDTRKSSSSSFGMGL